MISWQEEHVSVNKDRHHRHMTFAKKGEWRAWGIIILLFSSLWERGEEMRYIGHKHTNVWDRTAPCDYDSGVG